MCVFHFTRSKLPETPLQQLHKALYRYYHQHVTPYLAPNSEITFKSWLEALRDRYTKGNCHFPDCTPDRRDDLNNASSADLCPQSLRSTTFIHTSLSKAPSSRMTSSEESLQPPFALNSSNSTTLLRSCTLAPPVRARPRRFHASLMGVSSR